MAEVMAIDELMEAGTVAALKEKGRWRQEGKNYEIKDGKVNEGITIHSLFYIHRCDRPS